MASRKSRSSTERAKGGGKKRSHRAASNQTPSQPKAITIQTCFNRIPEYVLWYHGLACDGAADEYRLLAGERLIVESDVVEQDRHFVAGTEEIRKVWLIYGERKEER